MAWVRLRRTALQQDEQPDEPLESPADGLVRELALRQTNTQITLQQQLLDNKLDGFERGTGFVRVEQLGAGATSLQEFEEQCSKLEKEEVPVSSRATCDSAVSTSTNTRVVSRHELDLARSVKPGSVGTRLYQFATGVVRSPSPFAPGQPHPAASLQALDQQLKADPVKAACTVRRKRRQLLESMAPPVLVPNKPPEPGDSLWDVVEPLVIEKKPRFVNKTYTCKKQTLYTVKDGKIVQVSGKKMVADVEKSQELRGEPFVAVDSGESTQSRLDSSQRLSEDQIRQLPRFTGYQRGQPSKTLYIKNLASNVLESDLASVFVRFQGADEQKIIFRLMAGKMRGQAFITFNCIEKATEALKQANGLFLNGKPMIIAYGKQQNS